MRRLLPLVLVLLAPACVDKTSCPPGGSCAAPNPTPNPAEPLTPVALDPDRPQPPPPTALDVSRTMERAPRSGE
jgi:hypothetical protein